MSSRFTVGRRRSGVCVRGGVFVLNCLFTLGREDERERGIMRPMVVTGDCSLERGSLDS